MSLVFVVGISTWLATSLGPPEPDPPEPDPPAEAGPVSGSDDAVPPPPSQPEAATGPEADVPPEPLPPEQPQPPEPVEQPAVAPTPDSATPSPDPFAGPGPVADDDERAPLERSGADLDDDYHRRGGLLTVGVGITHCAQDVCSPIVLGGLARIELGYRFGYLALVGTAAGGGGKADESETSLQSVRMLDIAAGLLFFPAAKGPVDPYLGASLGYARTIEVASEDSGRDRQFDSRGAVRLSGGLAWYVRPRLALGPRADVRVPFAGKYCTRFPDDPVGNNCISIRDEIIEANPDADPYDKRRQRRAFAHPWAVTLDLRYTF